MSNIVQSSPIESALVQGDLSKLTPNERVAYYNQLCASLDLNPLTKPFEYIILNGKLTLYARKDCTDQLRTKRSVSIIRTEREVIEGIATVTVYARDKDGREDTDMGAVDLTGLKGEKLANAMMKAITKAKRRVTLSICGLGMLDETEVADIPEARAVVEQKESKSAIEILDGPESVREELGQIVCNFGTKYRGQKLVDIGEHVLAGYLKWMEEKVLSNDRVPAEAVEFYRAGEAYLKSCEFKVK